MLALTRLVSTSRSVCASKDGAEVFGRVGLAFGAFESPMFASIPNGREVEGCSITGAGRTGLASAAASADNRQMFRMRKA